MSLIDLFIDLLVKLIGIYIAIAIGIIWRFSRLFKDDFGKIFTQITIWIFFPVTIIYAIITVTSFDFSTFISIGILAIILHVGGYYIMIYISSIRKNSSISSLSVEEKMTLGSQAMVATFPNFVFYPFPIILATIGEAGLVYATIFVLFTIIIRNSFGVYIGLKYSPFMNGEKSELFSAKQQINRVILETVKFPPFLAMVVGFLILGLFGTIDFSSNQGIIPEGVTISKDLSMVLSLILIGLSFQSIEQLKIKNLLSRKSLDVSLVRFIIAPIISIPIVLLLGLSNIAAFPVLIQCMAPPAVSNIIYAKFFGLAEDEIAIYVTSLTIISLIILPFELVFLSTLFPY